MERLVKKRSTSLYQVLKKIANFDLFEFFEIGCRIFTFIPKTTLKTVNNFNDILVYLLFIS